ncbi:MAG: alpha/beta fold hydrolase [Candidatus Nanopelagicales bacterium]|jgi:pimeloyl-ACP methyl ester carboxylesterase|nr:alpha/beta fold hydrolase [Candidatus Nanopelagicales bacterium]MDP4907682.1 alpha/beta fold hydrolase [Candidatus Nanopelagicales bacterium]MDP4975675.1 alpha/beta fold hydrolase [Candidatus Nanopelagicales bacterium]
MADLAYDRAGSGPPLVLIHGLASSRRCWDLVMGDLSSDFTVYAIDLPGHGESDPIPGQTQTPATELALAVGRFLDEHDVTSAHLVGNSLGGWTALEAAADGRALSVTALCPAGLWEPLREPMSAIQFNRRAAVTTRRAIPTMMRVAPLRRTLMRAGSERAATVPYRVAVDAAYAQADARGFAQAHDGALHRSFERAASIPIDVPVTIAFGDNDRLLPAPRFQRRDLAPAHARWDVLWNCGHAPMWDVPKVTTQLIRATSRVSRQQ